MGSSGGFSGCWIVRFVRFLSFFIFIFGLRFINFSVFVVVRFWVSFLLGCGYLLFLGSGVAEVEVWCGFVFIRFFFDGVGIYFFCFS